MPSTNDLTRVLFIDLTNRLSHVEKRPDLFTESIGGAGVAIRLLTELCPPETDPLGPENPIILAIGPLVGLFPMASKTTVMFKSPHSGNLGESHAGGRSAVSIRMAGFGAIVIQGKGVSPVYVVIDGDEVHFRDASALWGLYSNATAGSVLREREAGSGQRTILRIGRAGELGVTYANVTAETYRHFGRLGLGAVFGSKLLKALVISGRTSIAVKDRKTYRSIYDEIFKSATQSSLMQKYHELGTSMNVIPLNEIGGLPTRNLQSGRFEGAEKISGESLAAGYLGRRVACAHCPIACIHLAALRIPYPNDPYFYKTSMISYDHEPIYATGSMLGIDDVSGMLRLLDEIEVHGMDVMTCGVTLAWATEAFQKGLISTSDTDELELHFGDADTYIQAARRIITQPTDFYRAIAHGAEYAAKQYGGLEYALTFGGNEMPGYHTGPASHLGYLVGARHSHLDNAGYSLDEKSMTKGEKLTPEEIANALWEEESWRQVLTSLVICLFARGVYSAEVVQRALDIAGYEFSVDNLKQIGTDTLRLKNAFKSKCGFDVSKLRIPERILETASPQGMLDEKFIHEALDCFAKKLVG